MQLSNAPGKLVLPFANAGAKNAIPVASQIGITAGAASLTDGFPPLTRTPIAAGGVPPSGLDMNGILYALSAALCWVNAGGGYVYDSSFANDSNVTGYPKGARVLRSDGAGYWLNTIDGNTVDPESVTVNAAQVAGWVPDLTNGVAAVTMTNANVTLTPMQYGKPIIVLSGTLTANLNLIFPNLAGEWTVVNNCTGAFTVTAKTAAGTGTVVTPGRTRIIWGDGANIAGATNEVETPAQFDNTTRLATTAFVKRSGNTLSQFNAYAASATLPASVAGSLVQFYGSTAGQAITLPLSSAVNAADEIVIFNYSTVSVTIQRQGAEQIAYGGNGGATSITLLPGDSVVLCAGTALWMIIGGTVANKYSDGFQVSAGAAGYQVLPSGTILQWGVTASAIAGDLVQTLPIAFPNAFERVIVTQAYTPGSGSIGYAGASPTTLSTFTWRGSAVGTGFQYLAIGR